MVESNRFTADGVETEETLQHTLAGFTDNAAVATPAQPDIPHTHSLGLDEDWLRLAFVALPATRCHMVLARWQNPTALMEAVRRGQEAELLATPGITPPTIDRLREAATRDLKQAYAAMETHNIRLLRETDEEYPVALHGISDPPPYLFIRGNVAAQDEVAV
ncbi:MAG: hypothetical protein JOZ57_11540, partial [Abitibacteriaceae bacterium]|nr:hypothetical protein [Abditibacteriaceae bacterium]